MLVDRHTVEEIHKAAKEGNFSLIVVEARVMSKIQELLLEA